MRLPAVQGISAPTKPWLVTPYENNSLEALASKIDHEAGSLETKSLQALQSKIEHETGSLESQSLRFPISCSFAPGTLWGGDGPGVSPGKVMIFITLKMRSCVAVFGPSLVIALIL